MGTPLCLSPRQRSTSLPAEVKGQIPKSSEVHRFLIFFFKGGRWGGRGLGETRIRVLHVELSIGRGQVWEGDRVRGQSWMTMGPLIRRLGWGCGRARSGPCGGAWDALRRVICSQGCRQARLSWDRDSSRLTLLERQDTTSGGLDMTSEGNSTEH